MQHDVPMKAKDPENCTPSHGTIEMTSDRTMTITKGLRPRKGLWFVFTAAVALITACAITKIAAWSLKPHVLVFGAKDHENKNFNSFPIDIPEREFDDWLS